MEKAIEKKCDEVIEYRFSDPQKAYDICCEILEHGTEADDYYEMAYARLYMGDTMFSLGNFEEAIHNMLIAEKIEVKYGYEDLLMKTYNIIAIIYVNQGDGLLGMDYYCKALELAKKRKDEIMQGMLYNNMGALLHNTGENTISAQYFKKCYELSQKREEKEKKPVRNKKQYCVNLALGYLIEKKFDKVKEYLDIAGEIKDDEGSFFISPAEINRIVDYVSLYHQSGDIKAAYEEVQKILSLPEEAFEEVEAFRHFMGLMEHLIAMGFYEEARKLLTLLEKRNAENNVLKRRIQICENWIRYYKATGEKELLQKYYRKYFELQKENEEKENQRVIQAIDNRYKLEYERMINEQLSANTRELMKTSEIDELTGISNRYGLKKRFNKLCEIAKFQKSKVCICIFDVDEFKLYNDEYGHLRGDECLKEIAKILLDTAGEEYFTSRYGGDEFVILGIGKSDEELEKFIEKLFRNINKARMPFLEHREDDYVTISMGGTNQLVGKEYNLADFIHVADRKLYEAKRQGKNRYILDCK